MKNIRIFYLKFFPFLVVKFSIYLNRRVFVMVLHFNKVQGKEIFSSPSPKQMTFLATFVAF